MHRARCGLLFSATALPLGVAAAPNLFLCRRMEMKIRRLPSRRDVMEPEYGGSFLINNIILIKFKDFPILPRIITILMGDWPTQREN